MCPEVSLFQGGPLGGVLLYFKYLRHRYIMEYGSTPYVGMAPKQNGVSINYV